MAAATGKKAIWTPEEEQKVCDLLISGQTLQEVSESHGRSVNAIKARITGIANKMHADGKTADEIVAATGFTMEVVEKITSKVNGVMATIKKEPVKKKTTAELIADLTARVTQLEAELAEVRDLASGKSS